MRIQLNYTVGLAIPHRTKKGDCAFAIYDMEGQEAVYGLRR